MYEKELRTHRQALYALFRRLQDLGQPLLLRSDIVEAFEAVAPDHDAAFLDSGLAGLFTTAQEAIIRPPLMALAARPGIARWQHWQFHLEDVHCREMTPSEFLAFTEGLVDGEHAADEFNLELDLSPFERGFPKMKETRSIGSGVQFLNRHLSSRLFSHVDRGDQSLFEFLKLHHFNGQHLMLNPRVADVNELRSSLGQAIEFLESTDQEAPFEILSRELARFGFEPGWGANRDRIAEQMRLLSDILEAPSASNLEAFIGEIPMIFRVVILSPHGYFGQANVLGKPDTGGQVVYILDQVRALEQAMCESFREQGLDIEPQIVVVTRLIPEAGDTNCDQRLESITGTENARILRVPFRTATGEVVPHWISRFHIWPYLEQFTIDAEKEILLELGSRPDFVIGNYSDGNLVATLLSQRLGVTQCNIAHALEKTKYLHSDLYWREHEDEHHFSCQFTADLIAMNTADFIITSTYQEIAGTRDSVGQYESYERFTLPGLYRVCHGVDVFDPKFNVVSPGANEEVFFPHTARDRRDAGLTAEVRDMVHGGARPDALGFLEDPAKPVLFAMSRLDRIKNAAGFVEWYAGSKALQEEANLLLVGGQFDPASSFDNEERQQIEQLVKAFSDQGLEGRMRWLVMQTDKNVVGEIYRHVADGRGVFVQPALFEAFGLTVVEAMSCGLPVFATRYGGPLEIIEPGVSGFHIDPNHGEEAAASMAEFLRECRGDASRWDTTSSGALDRIAERYTWRRYARRLLTLCRIYGFWKYISKIEREETRRYLEMFYGLMYRPLADRIES